MTFGSRLRALLGLDFDFDVQLRGDALSTIDGRFVVGARPTEEDIPTLRDAGVSHVVSCLGEHELRKVRFLKDHVTTLAVPVRDAMDQDIAAWFPRVFDFDAEAPSGARILVHCEAGVSRSATLTAGLLMRREGRSFFDAFMKLRAGRPGVLPNIGFASQLQRLERQLDALGGGRNAPRRRERASLRSIPSRRCTAPTPARESPSSLTRYLREVCHAPVEEELLQQALARHDDDAPEALRALFGGEIPRVVQGVRL
ncbi:MAG: dual specificity protein phosphatase family protein [Sandaracinaceae bacterium]